MALVWLKAVPWSTLLSNAPLIVDAAKRLTSLVKHRSADGTASVEAPDAASALATLRARVQELEQRQQEGAELLRSLAETNAELARAVELLRRRAIIIAGLAAIALLCVVALGSWVALR